MMYSLEDIYKYSGQFDSNVTIIFYRDTESIKLYGKYITGSFIYTPKERQEIKLHIENDLKIHTNGYVKFEENLRQISEEQRKTLRSIGILASDIYEIYHLIKKTENLYNTIETRELPKTIGIKVNNSDFDSKNIKV